jgi:serine/threonine protein kinase
MGPPNNTRSIHSLSMICNCEKNLHAKLVTPERKVAKIGSGTYGSVYRNSENIVEKKYNHDNEMLGNYVEVMFLKSFKAPFIPEIKDVTISNIIVTKSITMNYCGPTLSDISKKLQYVKRIQLLPKLIVQMARFLIWMKSQNICHMDIKPNNICIADVEGDAHLTFIDWGFVGIVCKNSDYYVGTSSFADPKYLENKVKISHEYDTFTCGMTLLSFLTKDSVCDFESELPRVYADMKTIIGKKYVKIVKSMTDTNWKKRITPQNIYYKFTGSSLLEKYPLYVETETIEVTPSLHIESSADEGVNGVMRGDLFQWLADVCIKQNKTYLYNHVTSLVIRVLNLHKQMNNKILRGYGIACYLISDAIFNIRTNRCDDLDFAVSITDTYDTYYGATMINEYMVDILHLLDWKIYPSHSFPDWNINMDENQWNQWKAHFYTKDQDMVSRFLTMSNTEKIAYFRKNYSSVPVVPVVPEPTTLHAPETKQKVTLQSDSDVTLFIKNKLNAIDNASTKAQKLPICVEMFNVFLTDIGGAYLKKHEKFRITVLAKLESFTNDQDLINIKNLIIKNTT